MAITIATATINPVRQSLISIIDFCYMDVSEGSMHMELTDLHRCRNWKGKMIESLCVTVFLDIVVIDVGSLSLYATQTCNRRILLRYLHFRHFIPHSASINEIVFDEAAAKWAGWFFGWCRFMPHSTHFSLSLFLSYTHAFPFIIIRC